MSDGPRLLVVTVVHRPDDARILHRQIATLGAEGFRVTYAAPWSACGVIPPDGLDTRDLPRASGRQRLDALVAARRLLLAEAAAHDLVLLHDPELLIAARMAGVERLPPIVWDVHEDTAVALGDRAWIPGALRWLLRLGVQRLERWAERSVHLILAEDGYRPRFRRSHPVVRNHPWRREVGPVTAGERASVVRDPCRAVYVGRLSGGRGLEELIALGERLGSGFCIELVGPVDDGLRGLLEDAAAAGHVVWRGFIPNDQVGEILAGALVGLSLLSDDPNYRVSMPSKVVEYLAHGVPVVATPLPAVVELLESAGGGLLVPFGDVEATASAIERLAGDPLLHARLVSEGHAAAADRTWEVEGARFTSTLRSWAR